MLLAIERAYLVIRVPPPTPFPPISLYLCLLYSQRITLMFSALAYYSVHLVASVILKSLQPSARGLG